MSQLPSDFDPRNSSPIEAISHAAKLGMTEKQLRRLWGLILGEGLCTHEEWATGNIAPRSTLNLIKTFPRLELEQTLSSGIDNFHKLLFRTQDKLAIESVLIPLHNETKYSLCISSQVGCVMGCAFCATARIPKRRNLESWEIIDQFIQARSIARKLGRDIASIVFMGMGEPFLNYKNVISAAQLFCYPTKNAISGRSITISTVGLVEEIDKFTSENHPFRLSISLGAPTDEKRARLVPVAARTKVKDLMAAARRHALARNDRINIAYVCISGENTSVEDAQALGDLIGDTPVRLDLIDVRDNTGRFIPPSSTELGIFRDALRKYVAQPVARRYSGGSDINAGCGMLASQ